MGYKYKAIPTRVKDVDLKSGQVAGYFNTFNVKDSDGDITRPGAFTKTFAERGPSSVHPRIKYLMNHNITQVPGKLDRLEEDSTGGFYIADIGTHALGKDYALMIESGIITEHSFGFETLQEKMTSEGNNLLELRVWEISGLTAWGANQFTPIVAYAKSQDKLEAAQKADKRIKDIEKFVKNTTATDETIELLLIEIKQLTQYIVDLTNSTKAADEAPKPQEQDFSGLIAQMNLLTNNYKSI